MKPRKVYIRENSWLARIGARRLGYDHVALVLGHTIHLYNTSTAHFLKNAGWLRHELKHVEQYERMGIMGFLWKYLRESIANGYYNNSLEAEARAAEQDHVIVLKYDLSAYQHPAGPS